MKKYIFEFSLLFITVFVLFTIFTTVDASVSADKGFGGKITSIRSSKITEVESQGYSCEVPGKAIDIKPVDSSYPISYLIKNNRQSAFSFEFVIKCISRFL